MQITNLKILKQDDVVYTTYFHKSDSFVIKPSRIIIEKAIVLDADEEASYLCFANKPSEDNKKVSLSQRSITAEILSENRCVKVFTTLEEANEYFRHSVHQALNSLIEKVEYLKTLLD